VSASDQAVETFIGKWQGVAASELSTSQSFLIDLCRLLDVEAPHPTPEQDYMFERPITFVHGDGSTSAGRIDLYRRNAFVLESKKLKQGASTKGFDEAMLRARSQAEAYARALPAAEGRPPFVVVVDVGNRIELYSEFSRSGATYTPFPDPRSHRIGLGDLRDPHVRDRLRRVWTDPLSLDPGRESARVTRDIAERLATLARSLEQSGHAPEAVAQFLMRCLFTMFAEDVRLLPNDSFRDLLAKHREQPDTAMRMLAQLWRDMDGGGFSAVLANDVLQFNGKLFKQPDTLPLDREQLDLLIAAAKADWKHVEPAIFGTLLERALSPGERHKLGAHYTPRAYVERLVLPTVIEPLRAEWNDAYAAALVKHKEAADLDAQIAALPSRAKAEKGLREKSRAARDEAIDIASRFHARLCNVRVLDPACGTGNFLYVTLEHLKRLEGEVLNALDELGYRQAGLALSERADAMAGETVDPHNLLGIEINPRAAAIAEVVLWIGYLQWHFRTRGDVTPPQPVIRDFRNIETRDAVLAYDRVEFVTDERGVPVTRWDGRTMKPSPVTGEPVPDETARLPVERYVNPRKAEWPQADFIVGNPPFIGKLKLRHALGTGYIEALRSAWAEVPDSADLVMYWWHACATLASRRELTRFGLITTKSISHAFNRSVVQQHLNGKQPISLIFAVPNHPWVDGSEDAAVRIAMTVCVPGGSPGRVLNVTHERELADGERAVTFEVLEGPILPDLRVGIDLSRSIPLKANDLITNVGVIPHGEGFLISPADQPHLDQALLRRFRNGKDVASGRPRELKVVDAFELSVEELRARYPASYQWLLARVKPERDQNPRATRRENWWLFGENHPRMRRSIARLDRYIATILTAKHRTFFFIDGDVLPDQTLVVTGSSDALLLGALSSIVHVVWALANGSRLGVGNDPRYNKSTCFDTFPFPRANDEQSQGLRELAEELDRHRKRQQVAHPGLTITGMYNVLEKLRSGETLTAKERVIHAQGLVSVLRQIHDDLDAAVLDAYGWSDLLPLLRIAHGNETPAEGQSREDAKRAFDEAILERLVALNAERAAEEARGIIRWLRPEFQNPELRKHEPEQDRLAIDSTAGGAAATPAAGDDRHDQAAGKDTDGDTHGDTNGDTDTDGSRAAAAGKIAAAAVKPQPWPSDPVAQVRAVADVLAASPVPLSIDEIAARFAGRGPWKRRLPQLLEMLVALGRANEIGASYKASKNEAV
jgi:hypothetical protein